MNGAVPKIDCGEKIGSANGIMIVFQLTIFDHNQMMYLKKTIVKCFRGKTPVDTCFGIDLNRNFDFHWNNSGGASAAGCSGYFRGAKPFSEPESRNIEAFVMKR